MKNLIRKITKEIQGRENNTLERVNDISENSWSLKEYLKKNEKLETISKAVLIERIKKDYAKQLSKELEKLKGYANDTTIIEQIRISVEWVKSRTWGSNPTATAECFGVTKLQEGKTERYYFSSTGKASGCGYDKQSAAIASALNQIRPLIAAMYREANKAKNKDKKNSEIFGYGSGHGPLPYIEGGVGVSCYPDIFKVLGMTWQNSASGKSFDAYLITK